MTIVLGPVPCKDCRRPLVWDGSWWREAWKRGLHVCPAKAKAA